MVVTLNRQWAVRLENFGGLAFDKTGKSRFHYLNKAAAVLLRLCSSPRTREELLRQFPSGTDAVIDILIRKGILVEGEGVPLPIELEEQKELARRINSLPSAYLSAPFEVNLYTTTRCSVACQFCYLSEETRHAYTPTRMSREVLHRLLEDCSQMGVFSVNFLGGEPFLDQEAISYALDKYLSDFIVAITTNGTVTPSEEFLDRLAQPGAHVTVSIHSSIPEVHDRVVRRPGAWTTAWDTVDRLVARGVRTVIQMVPTRANTGTDIIQLVNLAREKGAAGFALNTPYPGSHMSLADYAQMCPPPETFGPVVMELNRLRDLYGDSFYVFAKGTYAFVYEKATVAEESPFDKFLTQAGDGVTGLEVMPDGSIFTGTLSLNGVSEPAGNLANSDLQTVWNSAQMNALRSYTRQLEEPCSSCSYKEFCGGGNPLISHTLFNRDTGGDIRCPEVWNYWAKRGSEPLTYQHWETPWQEAK